MRNNILATSLAAVTILCAGCTGHTRSSEPASATMPHSTAGAAPSRSGVAPLVRSRLAPKQVGTVDPGMHCRMAGTTPAAYRPDPTCTPGAVDGAVTQDTIDRTICTSGYTATVRPPASATDKVKHEMYKAYGLSDGTPSELDHLVSLELGGSSDVANLWPEPGQVPNPKDQVENALHKAVCAHKVTLAAAQQAIAEDWTTALAVTGVAQ